jgi:hypothetical protein
MMSPWIHKELQDIRAQLFVDSMNLHKSFIINSSDYITNNLKAMKYMMTSGYWLVESRELLPHILASFFIVVPTISTTFASFSSLFGNSCANLIGYLLVDEAEQSTPPSGCWSNLSSKKSQY